MPLVSVIIPTRRRHDLLARALAGVLAQTHRELEIVVVDDNDPGERVPGALALQPLLGDRRVRVVEGPGGRSAAAARNRGLQAATGEWITYLDDDDEYLPTKVARQLALAESSGAPLGLCGFAHVLGPRRRVRQTATDAFAGDAVLTGATWGTPFLFHRRDPAARFEEELHAGEDKVFAFDFIVRHGLRQVGNVPEALVTVYLQPVRTNLNFADHRRADEKILGLAQGRFSAEAVRLYAARSQLALAKHGAPSGVGMVAAANAVLRAGGWREARGVANAVLFRLPWTRRWVVS